MSGKKLALALAKGLVSKTAVKLVKARISAAKRITGICGEQKRAITIMQRVPGSAAEFSWPLGVITGFPEQGNLVRKNQKKASIASPCSRGLAVSWPTQRELRRTGVLVASKKRSTPQQHTA